MQDKSEVTIDIAGLPSEMWSEVVKHLPKAGLFNFYRASTTHKDLSAYEFNSRKATHTFLRHVVCGEHEQVKAMLEQDIDLLFKREQVRDCSDRVFFEISGFEYALWALDKHMWTLMLECIPRNEKGKEVLARLSTQYKKLCEMGVSYSLHEKPITETHFNFANTIIKELQTQVDSINAPGDKNWDAIDKQWQEGVGGAQKLLPMHAVDEYCSNEPFYPVPKFTSQPKSSKQFYNWTTVKDENWFSADSKLAIDFAIYKGRRGARGADGVVEAGGDLVALTALCEVRTNDFINLKSELEEQMTLDNRHQVFQI
ncbi:hypothetical protein [Legionella drancourtii]|uniref:F-box domain-containing protein n=1 Tax=Legionella drancourtii LLAP12 TaxID=658187 RepID=G9EL78_9GAMM|nr:hypothetical protein [Legionella drancourtii]EHL31967.1 hypothetical protein LDG_6137 [Legionella drancourtii LLAP12]